MLKKRNYKKGHANHMINKKKEVIQTSNNYIDSVFDVIYFLEKPENLKNFLRKQDFYKNIKATDSLAKKHCILYALLCVLKDLKPMNHEEEYMYLSDISLLLNKVKCIAWKERKLYLDDVAALNLCGKIIVLYINDTFKKESVQVTDKLFDRPLKRMPNVNTSALEQVIRKIPYDTTKNDIFNLF